MRNGLAGSKKGKSKSAKYYQSNPKAREKKKDYDKKYHSSEERKEYREQLNRANRKMGKKGDGKDVSHGKGGMKLESQSRNRARNGSGDNKKKR